MILERETIRTTIMDHATKVECDVCKKIYNDMFEVQEFIHISIKGGYCSVFGDGNDVEIDICQHCFKEKFADHLRITVN
jgi:hypothetical protein